MKEYIAGGFFKNLFGFVAIIGIGFVVMITVNFFDIEVEQTIAAVKESAATLFAF